MTTIVLKRRVIDEVNKVNDESILMDLMRLLNDNDDNEIHRLSDKHKRAVQTAINKIENGNFVTNDQANNEIEEWLRKSG
jgi:predicted transcriptional regulator